MEVVEERRRMRRAALESAAKAVERIEEVLGPVSAVVIGSYARGDFNRWSDVDLLVVSPNFYPNPLKRFEQVLEAMKASPNVEIIPLTPAEFQRQLRLKTPIAEEATKKGIVVRDGLNLLKEREKGSEAEL
ncbi:MAG: nucleotidyltransferase domain-containing protein [Nitrososphaerota archaeon]|nr:nucleotidyltransferase domain-containing protein [Candidatus Calditenuaceae archaeon]MDW8073396.1 nucleotidyltransferase domain-containing protein [Nitrososphaerota archaeon]